MASRSRKVIPPESSLFDSIEEKIRGEEILTDVERRSLREEAKIKKELQKLEVNRRLNELKKKIGKKQK